jgi:RIO-like serine/threonine protein kinase
MSRKILGFVKFNKSGYNDQRVIRILKFFGKPVPFETIALLTGLRKDKTAQVLRSLQKYGLVRKYYKRMTSFWGIEALKYE